MYPLFLVLLKVTVTAKCLVCVVLMRHRVLLVFAWSYHPNWVCSQWHLEWSRCLVNLGEEEEFAYRGWVLDSSPGLWLTFYSTSVHEPSISTELISHCHYGGPQHVERGPEELLETDAGGHLDNGRGGSADDAGGGDFAD